MSKSKGKAPYIYRSAAGRVPHSEGPPSLLFARAAVTRRHIRAASSRRGQAVELSAAWALA